MKTFSQTLTLIKVQEPCVLLKLLPSPLSGRTLVPYCQSLTSFSLSRVVFVLTVTFDRPSCLRSSRVLHLWLQQPTSASATTHITVVRIDPIYTASIRTFTIIRLFLRYDFGCHLVPCSHGATFKVARSSCRSHYTARCHPRQDFWPGGISNEMVSGLQNTFCHNTHVRSHAGNTTHETGTKNACQSQAVLCQRRMSARNMRSSCLFLAFQQYDVHICTYIHIHPYHILLNVLIWKFFFSGRSSFIGNPAVQTDA